LHFQISIYNNDMSNFIFPLMSEALTLETAGGKGANLSMLLRSGFPVPAGFVVTTAAYQAFVANSGLRERIAARLSSAKLDDPLVLDAVSHDIRASFGAAPMPAGIADEIKNAYGNEFNSLAPVAVRSSATAEDLPEMSFAGQQDTYLNIIGEPALLKAVVDCWSSLWTARAIGYRARNNISHSDISLAVVVQQMVSSDASGVLFTANPLSGLRSELVIDATFGLGEALVSGQVEPDHYIVSKPEGRLIILSKTLGSKALAIHADPKGGVIHIQSDASQKQALSDEQILALAQLGWRVSEVYGTPQDIEWAFADGKLTLLQSRAITSLFPIPDGVLAEPLKVWVSFGAVQGMLDPMTPLGREGIFEFVVSIGRFLGFDISRDTQTAFHTAAERIFTNVSSIIRNRIGRFLLPKILGVIEPGTSHAYDSILDDPRLAPGRATISLKMAWRLASFVLPTLARFIRTIANPDAARERAFEGAEELYSSYADEVKTAKTLAQRLAFVDRAMTEVPRFVFRRVIPVFAPGYAMFNALDHLAKDVPNGERLALEVTRGLPYNVTTEMDLVLWETARMIKNDAISAEYFADHSAAELASAYFDGMLPAVAQSAVVRFIDRYGARGVGEIDGGRVRWREDPTLVMHSLLSYLQIEESRAPDVMFQRATLEAEAAVNSLASAVRQQPGGWFKARQVRFVARRVRALAGVREMPKFFAVRVIGLVRSCLLKTGEEFATLGILNRAGDIYFLHMSELYKLPEFQNADGSWRLEEPLKALAYRVTERKKLYEREQLRRQIPRILLSDGRAFYGGIVSSDASSDDAIFGNPVSPGVVEGTVHVVFDPHGTRLEPGEILICPGTDPAWTPLFLSAGGLVMEVGGLMTHGAVVAREYGIPAVVGVRDATRRLVTGQRIRVDGNSGHITILD
jgi:phosphohistidine swiveling domain-containing protein